ncbi:aromatic ring-hydroxylating oxygenase subunit alpha [Zavarzinia compransoris]|uniref:2Fe-2S ferredoxin n=1 Tax=Zavarzinia compransoris TaxID=1264899 RepID=A0A317E5C7_9PROT|nr:aromatic ring-hydroxylating dioxygenase subunit alpha [Zavarzinia compransoris]PWR21881.1 2Fe-2S ferredoxin [Zavarzinia compransoris]TDP45313.1 choline monooxygenase [Zavarzinia compransoris]
MRQTLLRDLQRPLVQAIGLPSEAYTDEGFFARERERLLARTWVAVATASDLTRPGDLLPLTVAGQPVLLVHGQDGAIRAFHNVCTHRGLQLVEEAGNQRLLRCPYHAWAFDLEGRLRATPHFGGIDCHALDGFEPGRHGLRPVRLARWHDLILLDLSGEAPDFAGHAAPLAARWQAYDFGALRHGARLDFTVAANWKLLVENFCDTYHLPFIHPQVNEYSKAEDHYDVIDGMVVGTGNRTAARDGAPEILPRFPGLPAALARTGEFLALFPNTLIFLMPDHYFTVTVTPIDAGHSHERLDFYFVGEAATDAAHAARRAEVLALWAELNRQDIAIVERLHRGRVSRAFEGGCFTPALEAPLHHVQSLVAQMMDGV